MTGSCWQGGPHLRGFTRRDGSLWCARCGVQIQPPDPAKAWGKGCCDAATLQPLQRGAIIVKAAKPKGGPNL